MKTFAEYLPTMTAREREIVEAYDKAFEDWAECRVEFRFEPIKLMRATPPAKEPVSAMAFIVQYSDGSKTARIVGQTPLEAGTRVRVTKIEETK